MAGGITNVASGVQTTDALLGLFRWSGLSLTYNFPDTAAYYDATYFTAGSVPSGPGFDFATFAAATASLEAAIDKAIASELMAVAPLVYTKTAPGADADSSFAMSSLFADAELGAPPGGIGYYPALFSAAATPGSMSIAALQQRPGRRQRLLRRPARTRPHGRAQAWARQ